MLTSTSYDDLVAARVKRLCKRAANAPPRSLLSGRGRKRFGWHDEARDKRLEHTMHATVMRAWPRLWLLGLPAKPATQRALCTSEGFRGSLRREAPWVRLTSAP